MRGQYLKRALGLGALIAMSLPGMASAERTGINSCPTGKTVKFVYNTVHIPAYISNAQRGDIVLTSGGDGAPKALLQAIGQIYNHTLFVSQPLTAGGHTTFTHDTAIELGKESMDFAGLAPYRFKPDQLRRMVPGNIIGDTAQTLLHGKNESCLNYQDAATCMAIGARPENLWRTDTILLRPNNGAAAVNVAETWAPGSLLYSVGAYSDYTSALTATNQEAGLGQGTMCSGFVSAALNATGVTINPVFYSQATRTLAANALDAKIYDKLASSTGILVLLAFITAQPQLVMTARNLTNQVVNCFASGGACTDQQSWQGRIGTGTSISGDDLLADARANGWATEQTASFGGDYDIQQFSHIECCTVNEVTGEESCAPPGFGEVDPIRGGGLEPAPTPVNPTPPPDETPALDSLAMASGEFVERADEYCWVTQEGSICTPLEADSAQVSKR